MLPNPNQRQFVLPPRASTDTAIVYVGVGIFIGSVLVEHVLDRSLDPASHEISEYVHGPFGSLMTIGFAGWSVALWATSRLVARRRHTFLAFLLGLAAAGMTLTAIFSTETSAGRLPVGKALSWNGRLHDIGSGTTSIALFLAAVVSLRVIPVSGWRRGIVALLATAALADVALLLVGNAVGGLRQRILIVVGCTFQVLLVRQVGSNERSQTPQAFG